MAERIYPSAKPNPPPPAFPATKAQTYSRPTYRPPPKHQPRRRRSRCCSCCLCLTLFLAAVIIAAAMAGGVFYALYRPHCPSFSVSALNLTSSSHLDLSITATNPNKKIAFAYGPFSVSVASDGASFGTGTFSSFVHNAKNTTVLKTVVLSSSTSSIVDLKKKKKKSSVPLVIEMETKVGANVGKLKTEKVGIKVTCEGLSVSVPKKKGWSAASTPDVSCMVKLRIKIWEWTI